MGHSRGGDVAVAVVKRLAGHADFKVLAACSLAPTDFTGTATDATQLKLSKTDLNSTSSSPRARRRRQRPGWRRNRRRHRLSALRPRNLSKGDGASFPLLP